MPYVSIVTTFYNPGESLRKTIESVLSQTYSDFEYILMDGGSTDGSDALCESFRAAFEARHIPFLYYTQKDDGIYDGMNHGVAHCSGTFVNFMNADDCFYDCHVLENIFKTTSDTITADIIYGDAITFEYGKYYHFDKNINKIERSMPFSHQSVFARRALLLEHPFQVKYKIGADYDFLLTAYKQHASFIDCRIPVCIVTLDGLSSIDLYHTFTETVEIQTSHGIRHYTSEELKRKLQILTVKQFVMNHFPAFIKMIIRRTQRVLRHQPEVKL